MVVAAAVVARELSGLPKSSKGGRRKNGGRSTNIENRSNIGGSGIVIGTKFDNTYMNATYRFSSNVRIKKLRRNGIENAASMFRYRIVS